MYGSYNPYMVYGVKDSNSNRCIDPEWLDCNFPSLWIRSSDVRRNTMCNAVYGYNITVDSTTGQFQVTEEQKETVQRLYTLLCEFSEKVEFPKPTIGYYVAISGDFEKSRVYVPE